LAPRVAPCSLTQQKAAPLPIQFPVARGTILLCDYSTGFRPEMVKRRPAVVISHRLPHRDGLATVVPLSTMQPRHPVPYVCEIVLSAPLPAPFTALVMWAKADMLATVGFGRLDLFRTSRDAGGRRRYLHPRLPPDDIARIEVAICHALGLPVLTEPP
jgi:mRNA interferase MazF